MLGFQSDSHVCSRRSSEIDPWAHEQHSNIAGPMCYRCQFHSIQNRLILVTLRAYYPEAMASSALISNVFPLGKQQYCVEPQ